ncbi:MAG: OmpA family protein [Vicinamibacteria bacterium]
MRHSTVALALALSVGMVGCGKPKPQPVPVAPAVPETPPPAPQPPPEVAPALSEYDQLRQKSIDEIEKMGLLGDIHFDLDSSDLRDQDRQILSQNADTLKKFDFLTITVEGHCDERGSVEYNLALGERRAKVAYDYLVSLGVSASRLKNVSYGKEVSLCQDSTEECYARNRRDHFAVTGKSK